MFNWFLKLLAHHGEPAPKSKELRELGYQARQRRNEAAKKQANRHRNFTDKEEQPWL